MISIIVWFLLLLPQSPIEITFENATFRVSNATPEMVEVYVDSSDPDIPPVSGQRTARGKDVVFVPRYPLAAGLRYKVVVRIPGRPDISRVFETPRANFTPTTQVDHIYPTTNRLPENHLKFYIHFSAPMSRGEAYQRIHLQDETGSTVELAFLELEQELWDLSGQRLTLFFDPGRIKRDVLPNEQIGPSIVAGKRYTLVIDKEWLDAAGKQLTSAVRKTFSVAEADRQPLDIRLWKTGSPAAGSTAALTVDFPEPLDHALMLRQFEVLDAAGNILDGTVAVDQDETRWTFKPAKPWIAGAFGIRVGTIISDLAGNMIDRPFEVDKFDTVTERLVRETRVLPFTIR